MTLVFDLGTYRKPISTECSSAQAYFDQAINWLYGFNHEEAAVCFRRMLETDPKCAIAWWGIALASGPFYNMPWDWFSSDEARTAVAVCHDAAQKALSLAESAAPVEQALIKAIAIRFPSPRPACSEISQSWEDAYAEAMRGAYRAFPDDHDITALFAEALMTRTPWRLWDIETGEPAKGADTLEALSAVERALAQPGGRRHPGLLHMHIHLVEMSKHPERGLLSADSLCSLVPDAGHLEHMPCHIYALCGAFDRAVTASERAIAADKKYLTYAGANNFYTTARCHDLHMMMYAGMMSGRLNPALEAADQIVATLTPDLIGVHKPHMAVTVEGYYSTRNHVLVRFGRWHQILEAPSPPCPTLYCVSTAMHHYARALAHAALGNIAAASEEQATFLTACARVPENRLFFNNQARDILAIGAAMLQGELDYRRGSYDAAFAHLRRAATLDDALYYSEPWAWMHPPRHALGALLLEQDRVEEAASAYREDLGLDPATPRCCQHPGNVWALHGYAECLQRLGHKADLAGVKQQLNIALARADVDIQASCCCRGASPAK